MSSSATTQTITRPHTTFARGWVSSRVLASIAALTVAVAAWMPWASAVGTSTIAGHTRRIALQLSPGDVHDVIGSFTWSALTVAGALICPLLWARRDRLISLLAVVAYTLWVLVFTGVATSRVGALFQPVILLTPDLGIAGLDVTSQRVLLLGFFLACGGIILSLIACLALFLGVARLRAGSSAADASLRIVRARSKLPAAGALTACFLLWIAGTLILPWATVNCASAPLLFGRCTGIPFDSALAAGIRTTTTVFDPLAAKFAVPVLLIGTAVLLLGAIWLRRLTRRLCAWITLWLAASAACVALADRGVSAVVADPAAQGLPAGAWSGDNGIACALLALLIGLGGAVYLWIAAFRAPPLVEASTLRE